MEEEKELESQILGKSFEEAEKILESNNRKIRCVVLDGKHRPVRESYVPKRLNVEVEGGKVKKAVKWG